MLIEAFISEWTAASALFEILARSFSKNIIIFYYSSASNLCLLQAKKSSEFYSRFFLKAKLLLVKQDFILLAL